MRRRAIAYWCCAAVACVAAVLPYVPGSLFDYRFDVDFAAAGLWIVSFGATVNCSDAGGRRWWWVALTGPFALFHAIEFVVTAIIWIVFGFV